MPATVYPIPLGLSVAYLLVGEEGPVLVDAGLPGSERLIARFLQRVGLRPTMLRLIVLTHAHPDHCGALPALRALSSAPLAAHPTAAMRLRGRPVPLPAPRRLGGRTIAALARLLERRLVLPALPIELPLEDGASLAPFGLEGCILHTPGHTADSLTVLLEGGAAFVGDLFTRRNGRAVPQPYFIEDPEALRESVARLRAQGVRLLYTGHSPRPLRPAGW
jgi:glyoxylase-like metal-dependent hydrolase (beta-lactamase superfamily II)